jgi:hypothetical protein
VHVRVWVPENRSPYAACEYSPIRPPRRSRRTTGRPGAATNGRAGRAAVPVPTIGAGGAGCHERRIRPPPDSRRRLGFPIPDQEPEPVGSLAEFHQQVPGLLGQPLPAGCALTPSTWTRRLPTLVANSTYGRRSNTVSTVNKPTARIRCAWARRNYPPGHRRPLRGGINPGTREKRPDHAGSDPVAQPAQLAMDPAVAPGRVLCGQSQHQVADLDGDRRPAASARIRPPSTDQVPTPPQQRARLHEQAAPQPAR